MSATSDPDPTRRVDDGEQLEVVPDPGRRSRRAWGVVSGGVIGLALLSAWHLSTDGSNVPGLVGATLEEAADRLAAQELRLGEVVEVAAHEAAEPGTVVASDPTVGQVVEPHTVIDLEVAPFTDQAAVVPRVTGRQEAAAVQLLDTLRFEVTIARRPDAADEGTVVAQFPVPRTQMSPGSTVAISVSEGPSASEPELGAGEDIQGVLGRFVERLRGSGE